MTYHLLEQLGFDRWYQDQGKEFLSDHFSVARIIEVNKNNYQVNDGQHEMYAEVSGKFMFHSDNSLHYPTVGDWVAVQTFDDDTLAIIHHILPRKSLLKRKDPGKATQFQLIAANIDYAFILQAADGNFNLNRLERYLVMVHESQIQPIFVLSKTDLIAKDQLADIREKMNRLSDKYLFLPISNLTGSGMHALQNSLQTGKTYCLLGSSGVGKTTLLNRLLGKQLLEVKEVRDKDGKGRHTTSRRQLVRLNSGSIFIDTPGMRELGNFAIDSGIKETYNDIMSYAEQCRFKDCTHVHEAGCAVKTAVEHGDIAQDKYENFLKIQKESAYYEMSLLEKKKRDKQLGKIVKNYKKMMRKK